MKALLFCLALSFFVNISAQERPNIVILLADDISRDAIGCYGALNAGVTPNIDKLAKGGLKLNNLFVTESMCAPARAELYTGLQPLRNGCFKNHGATKKGTLSLPHYLKKLGYRVGLAGKKHIRPASVYPFEKIRGFATGGTLSKPPKDNWQAAKEFFLRNDAEPFCLVLASIHAHSPWDAGDASAYPANKITLPATLANTKMTRELYSRYLAEVREFDQQLGNIVKILKEQKHFKNTLIVVLDENGAGMPGGKWSNYDWGMRSCGIMSWPSIIQGQLTSNALLQYCDIVPTLIDIAGGKVPKNLDGRSFKSLLKGKLQPHPRKYVYFLHDNRGNSKVSYSIRGLFDGRYKLLWNANWPVEFATKTINGYSTKGRDVAKIFKSWQEEKAFNKQADFLIKRYLKRPQFELYDLDKDPAEFANVVNNPEYAQIRKRLLMELKRWMQEQGDFLSLPIEITQ